MMKNNLPLPIDLLQRNEDRLKNIKLKIQNVTFRGELSSIIDESITDSIEVLTLCKVDNCKDDKNTNSCLVEIIKPMNRFLQIELHELCIFETQNVLICFIKILSELCLFGNVLQLEIVSHKIHLVVAKLALFVNSCNSNNKAPDIVKVCLELLANVGCLNPELNNIVFNDLFLHKDFISPLLNLSSKHNHEESLLVFLNRSFKDELLLKTLNLSYLLNLSTELIAIWSKKDNSSIDVKNTDICTELIVNIFVKLVSLGFLNPLFQFYINPITDDTTENLLNFFDLLHSILHSERYCNETIKFEILTCTAAYTHYLSNLLTQDDLICYKYLSAPCSQLALNIASNILINADTKIKQKILESHISNDLVLILLYYVRHDTSKKSKVPRSFLHSSISNVSSFFSKLKLELITCIATLSYGFPPAQEKFAKLEVMPLILSCMSYNEKYPLQREYSILAIRSLCQDCPNNSKFISTSLHT